MRVFEGRSVYSVSEINALTRRTLEQLNFWVEGELSSFKGHNSRYRYLYFDLKDPQTGYKLPCIFDPEIYLSQDFHFEDGMKVLALGSLTLWEKEARLQLHIVKMQEFGEGFLLVQLEKLKKELQQKGYFDETNKKRIPQFPSNIAVITSQVSDAWHDFKEHSQQKFGVINLSLIDVLVQGEKSADQIIKALKKADKQAYDIICIIRGGGSAEDLASYNDENLAKAIFEAKTPIVVGVGHEKDVTIASLTADIAASTPTDAAKIISADFVKLEESLTTLTSRAALAIKNQLFNRSQQLDLFLQQLTGAKIKLTAFPQKLIFLKKTLVSLKLELIALNSEKLIKNRQSLIREWSRLSINQELALSNLHHRLEIVSPENLLNRGYSVVLTSSGKILTNTKFVDIGEKLKVKLARGKLTTKVIEKND